MKKDKDLLYQSAKELVSALVNKKISAVELLEKTISRIETLDQKINAVVVRDFEQARLAAQTADAAIARGERKYQNYVNAAKKLIDNDLSIEACFIRGSAMSYRDWIMKTRIRGMLRQQWRDLFKEFDVILCPVMPTVAFPHDHSSPEKRQINVDGSLIPYNHQYAWVSIATLFGLPVTVVPIAYSEHGLPIGIQVIGDYLEDYTAIKFAELIERELGGFTPPGL